MPQGSEPDRGEKESDGKLIYVFFVCLWLTFGEYLSYFSQYKALMVLYNSISRLTKFLASPKLDPLFIYFNQEAADLVARFRDAFV